MTDWLVITDEAGNPSLVRRSTMPPAAPETNCDPDGEPTPLPTRTPHRYEILGFTPNKFGEH